MKKVYFLKPEIELAEPADIPNIIWILRLNGNEIAMPDLRFLLITHYFSN